MGSIVVYFILFALVIFLGLVNLGITVQFYRSNKSNPLVLIAIMISLVIVPYLILNVHDGDHYSNLDQNLNQSLTMIFAFYIGVLVYLYSKKKKEESKDKIE